MPSCKILRSSLPLATLSLLATSLCATPLVHLLPSSGEDRFDYVQGRGSNGTVAGHSHEIETVLPILWLKAGQAYSAPAALALPNGAVGGETRWIAPDASLVAGFAALPINGQVDINTVPLLWTRGAGGAYTAAILPRLTGVVSETVIHGGNASGTRLVGQSGSAQAATLWRGTPGGGYTAQPLLLPAGATNGPSSALASSASGARLAGRYESAEGTQSVVWTEGNPAYSPLRLGTIPGGAQTFVETLSADGTLAAGAAETEGVPRPVVWDTATGAATRFETLGGLDSTILVVADNKLWLGGRATDRGSFAGVAVLWDREGRIHPLTTLVNSAGASFPGFTPESVTGVQHVADGFYTITGTGVVNHTGATRGFVVENLALPSTTLPAPPPAPEPPPPAPSLPDPEGELAPAPSTPGGVFLNRQRPNNGANQNRFGEPTGPARILGPTRRE